ncbi:MAG: hypothetical protein NZ556_05775 [Fimbriimonadales bacterium]|nr:hypothetical protein [Fimbriimonadales bacterium]
MKNVAWASRPSRAWLGQSRPSRMHGQDCPCYLHGLEVRATQVRRCLADATRQDFVNSL